MIERLEGLAQDSAAPLAGGIAVPIAGPPRRVIIRKERSSDHW
jgi:hypothetical protein